jgi:glycosyltransferase involved in cell wall biosynthesis
LNVHHFEIIDHERPAASNLHEWKVFKQMERATERILKGNNRIRVFSERLLDKAKTMNPSARYSVVPFALDLSHYPVLPPVDEPVAGLIGSMHWLPSRSAAERLLTRIWPLVRTEIPSARLIVAGWNARSYLSKFASAAGVQILDNIPHPSEFFSRVAALIYPVQRGSGMKVKVMESMAYGVPVVTTPDGIEGLSGRSGVEYIVGETDETIAAETVRLLRASSLRASIREAGRALIEHEYSRTVVVTQMMKIYKEMIA